MKKGLAGLYLFILYLSLILSVESEFARIGISYDPKSCTMSEKVRSESLSGLIAARLQNFSECRSGCGYMKVKYFAVYAGNILLVTRNQNPILSCGGSSFQSLKDYFCFNNTDKTIRTTQLLQINNTRELTFRYIITVKRYADGDGGARCTLTLHVAPPTKTPSSSQFMASTLTTATRIASSQSASLYFFSSTPHITSFIAVSTQTVVVTPSSKAEVLPELLPTKSKEISATLGTGQEKVQFKCTYRTKRYQHLNVMLTWIKDGVSLNVYPGNLSYSLRNSTEMSKSDEYMVVTQFLTILTKPEAQGYYNCKLNTSNGLVYEGNKTLLWFTDVSTSKYFFQASIKGIDEKRLFTNIRKQLNNIGFKGDESKLFLSNTEKSANTTAAIIFIYFVNVSQSEKLEICKRMINVKKSFRSICLDCCPSRKTRKKPPTGAIIWPYTLLNETIQKKCPFGNKMDNVMASRKCTANFDVGPIWQKPFTENCPKKSETTGKLKELSEVKINDKNVKGTMLRLRNITKNSKKFTDQLDIDFATKAIENVLDMKNIMNQTADEILGTASDLMNSNHSIMSEAQRYSNASTRLLSLITKLCDDIEIRGSFKSMQENIAIGIETVQENAFSMGLNIAAFMNTTTEKLEVQFHERSSINHLAYVYLSAATMRKINSTTKWKTRRISSVAFKTSVLFQETTNNESESKALQKVDSKVISVSINGHRISDLKGDEELQNYFNLSSSNGLSNAKRKCVYWDVRAAGGLGKWSAKGCTVKGFKDGMFRCSCNHMTNFAILLDVTREPLSQSETKTLSIITFIGCAISLISLVTTISTYLAFRKLRKNLPSRILICLSFSLLATMVIFLGGSLVQSTVGCETIAVLLHYFVLASFCWMVVEAFNIYRCFVLVFKQASSRFLLKASIFAWGFPLLVVIITSVISRLKSYSRQHSEGWICIITGLPFYIAYLSPITLIILINSIVLITTIRSLSNQSPIAVNKRMTGKSKARIAGTFSALLGCTWVFGLFAIVDLKFPVQVLFCVFNSLQGFFIFVFFCLRNEDVRKEWGKVLCNLRVFSKAKGKHSRQKENKAIMDDFLSSRTQSTKELSTCM